MPDAHACNKRLEGGLCVWGGGDTDLNVILCTCKHDNAKALGGREVRSTYL